MDCSLSGCHNIGIGARSLCKVNGHSNIGIGVEAIGWNGVNYGGCNIAIGECSLHGNNSGGHNIAIGFKAGHSNYNGSTSIFLGTCAGYNETTGNKLYIANSETTTPLIYGDFAAGCAIVHGAFKTSGDTSLLVTPAAGATSDSILVWNSSDKLIKTVNGTAVLSSAITGATNGLTKVSQDVKFGGDLTENTTINLSTFDFNISGDSLQYSADYRADYNARSIPDVDYVTGYTQSAVTQNSNVIDICIVYANYSATTINDFIGVSGNTSYCIWLPPVPKTGQRISVSDVCVGALTYPIYVIGTNNRCINGASCATINTDYGSITFINNGSSWSAVSFIN